MSSILRRLTSQLDQKGAETQGGNLAGVGGNSIAEGVILDREDKRLMSAVSFNDFSMHVMMDEDHGGSYGDITVPTSQTAIQTKPVSIPPPVRGSDVFKPSLGKIRTPQSPVAISNSLKIPRTSVAGILGTPKASTQNYEETTPRSSLDLYEGSGLPTPRASLSREVDGEGSTPVSPKSPRTPGGRRKKQNKIHGLDYYEFCELVRAGSL